MNLLFNVEDANSNYNFNLIEKILWDLIAFNDISFTTPANPDDELELSHTLNRVPTKFITIDMDKSGAVIFKGDTDWTDSKVYIKSTVGNTTAKIRVF